MEAKDSNGNYVVTPEDFLPSGVTGASATTDQIASATQRYDYIFGIGAEQKPQVVVDPITGLKHTYTVNNAIHEFAVFGLTNEKFIEVQNKVDSSKNYEEKE